jgi:hypothetical protein
VKKSIIVCSLVGLLAVSLFVLAGCDTPSGSSEGRGVLGQVTGVLYDTVTLKPISDAEVQIAGSKVKTNANGYFLVKNVGVGEAAVSFRKDGYKFTTRTVFVDPNQYTEDDPFKEADALTKQLDTLKAAWEKQQFPGYYDEQETAADNKTPAFGQYNTWTYTEGGVYVNGDGVSVTIADDKFEIEKVKLDYTYNYNLPLHVIGVTPLNGAAKGNVKLVKATYPATSVIWDKVVPIDADIDLWFLDGDPSEILGIEFDENTLANRDGDDHPDPTVQAIGSMDSNAALYGPFKTNKDGSFEVTGLPAETPLTLVFNGFLKEGFWYPVGSTVYKWDVTTFKTTKVANPKAPPLSTESPIIAKSFPNNAKGFTNIGDLYIFSEGSFAVITDAKAGKADAPLALTDSIEITFSEPIDRQDFTAQLTTVAANAKSAPANIDLTVSEWKNDDKTIVLIPDPLGAVGSKLLKLPYSVDETQRVGYVTIGGSSKAKSGSAIYNSTSVNVYTKEGLKLTKVEIVAGSSASRALIKPDEIIKLTFNFDITKGSTFMWSDTATYGGTQSDWEFVAGSEKEVYVFTTLLNHVSPTSTPNNAATTGALPRYLSFFAIAKDDPEDRASRVIDQYAKPTQLEQQLTLKTTNLYTGKKAEDTYQDTLGAGKGTFAIGTTGQTGNIVLTFNTAFPAGNLVEVRLVKDTAPSAFPAAVNSISLTYPSAGSGTTLTITPNTRLEYETTYYLDLKVKTKEGYFIFNEGGYDNYAAYDDVILAAENGNVSPGPAYYTIAFQTVNNPETEYITLLDDSQGAGTSKQVTGISGINIVTAGGTTIATALKLETEYYIQLDTTYATLVLDEDSITSGSYTLTLRRVADDVLGFKIETSGTAPTSPASVTFTGTGTLTNPIINTDNGNISFSTHVVE